MQSFIQWTRIISLVKLALIITALGGCNQETSLDRDSSHRSTDECSTTKPVIEDGTQIMAKGQTQFISLSDDVLAGHDGIVEGYQAGTDANEAGTEERTVEEGDIYRVVKDGLLANLNHYRGLQLIDITDPNTTHVVSRLPLAGDSVEMYFIDGYAVIMMNEGFIA